MREYGFYGRLTEQFPSQIIVDVIENCNYECIHCPHSSFKKSDIYTGAKFTKELNKKLVDEARKDGMPYLQHIRYTANGEPLLHPDLYEILEYAVKESGTFVSLTTNGSLLTQELIEKLLTINIGLIDVSIDAYKEETYASIRRKGRLESVKNNVLELLKQKRYMESKTRIVVSFVEQEKNREEMNLFKNYWEEQGVDYVVLRRLHSAGGVMYHEENSLSNPCVYLWERMCIEPNGDIGFCPAGWQGRDKTGYNLSETTMKEVWNGQKYRLLREEHLNNAFSYAKVCELCPDRKNSIWPNHSERQAYGDMIEKFK